MIYILMLFLNKACGSLPGSLARFILQHLSEGYTILGECTSSPNQLCPWHFLVVSDLICTADCTL